MDGRDHVTRGETRTDRNRSGTGGPVGTVLGWTFGPFGAAVGTVVDANRFAFKLSVGAGADRERAAYLDRGTTIEIEDSDAASAEPDDTGE